MMEEIHDLIPDKLKIIQHDDYFKFGTDSVLLANFTKVKNKDNVVDLGSGSGVIPLLLAFKQRPARVVGIEIQPRLVEMARRSITLNHLEEIIQIKEGDYKRLTDYFEPGSVDVIVSNPPYMTVTSGKITEKREKAIARHELYADLEDLIREGSKVLKFGGNFNLVHRTWRMVEVISLLRKYHLEPKRIRFIQSRENNPSDIFLLMAKKGAKPGVKVKPVLIVYQGQTDEYTDEVKRIYGEV